MQAVFNQAVAAHQAGQYSRAEALYRQLLEQAPTQAVVKARLGILLAQTQRVGEGLACLAEAIEQLPHESELVLQAANIATQHGHTERAEEWLRVVSELNTEDASVLEQLAGVLIGNHKESDALECIKKLIKLSPQNANAYNLKGLALSRLGETDKGYKCFQKSVKMNPGQLGAVRNLVLYGKKRKEPLLDKIMPQLERAVQQQGGQPAVQMNVAYILAMYYENKGESQRSFRYLKMANDLNRAGYSYRHADTQVQFAALVKGFSREFVQQFEGQGLAEDGPVFILGMPRSGTTLIEQILSSHSNVGAEGEIEDLRKAFEDRAAQVLVEGRDKCKWEACLQVAQNYLDSVRGRQTAPLFTDKMPYNFMLVGLIATTMPKAKIIHCTRDSLETCFSIYKQNFSGSHSYTNNLKELGQYYNLYESLMGYWNELFPGRIHEANYEKLIGGAEQEITRLLEFCELPAEKACFEFHRNKRAVRTASVAQVRQPIYKDALKASSAYKAELEELIKTLESGEGREIPA